MSFMNQVGIMLLNFSNFLNVFFILVIEKGFLVIKKFPVSS